MLRERGLAIAANRSDRETSNGFFLVKKINDFAAIIALKCETDFVANGADFIKLTSDILDAAIAAKAHTLDEVKTLKVGESDAQAAVTQRSGITGEKMELDGYCVLEGDNIEVYDHMNKHTLCTMVQLNENNEEAGHKVAMQSPGRIMLAGRMLSARLTVASTAPIALADAANEPAST